LVLSERLRPTYCHGILEPEGERFPRRSPG